MSGNERPTNVNRGDWVYYEQSTGRGTVALRVTELTKHIANYWDQEIQPAIDRDPSRPDRFWHWPRMASLTSTAMRVLQQHPVGFAISIPVASEGRLVPCALVILAGRYPYLADAQLSSAFLWYVAAAPRSEIARLVPGPEFVPRRLGSFGIDVSLCHSFAAGHEGRLGLHADAKGGQSLFEWYLKHGMINLPKSKSLGMLRRYIRPNDGRYFYHDPLSALEAKKTCDPCRERAVPS